jgi:hypothetical protein
MGHAEGIQSGAIVRTRRWRDGEVSQEPRDNAGYNVETGEKGEAAEDALGRIKMVAARRIGGVILPYLSEVVEKPHSGRLFGTVVVTYLGYY